MTKAFARAVALALAAGAPDAVTADQAREARGGRVLVDWLQNSRLRSTVAPYSLRAGASPGVSTPLGWDEVETAVERRDPSLLAFAPQEVHDRLARVGDVWMPALDPHQRVPV